MVTLERIDGPECPRCGCQDTAVVSRSERWGQPFARRQCRNCGNFFQVADQAPEIPEPEEGAGGKAGNGRPVVYHTVRCTCPKCGAPNPPVTTKRRTGVRHHKCKTCGHTFKSWEK